MTSSGSMIKPKEYERAVAAFLKGHFPPPDFVVRHDFRLPGTKSKSRRRQIDAGVFERGSVEPMLIAEAKRRSRAIDVVGAGTTIALVRDVGSIPAIMVSSIGFSKGAQNYLATEGIGHLTLTLTEAASQRWIPLIEQFFPLDHAFRNLSGDLVEALRTGDIDPFHYADIPFEEWLAVMACGQSLFPESATRLIQQLAEEHLEGGVRYNALLLLDEAGTLTRSDIDRLLDRETDPDVIELLTEFR